jgi:hypothetical protein
MSIYSSNLSCFMPQTSILSIRIIMYNYVFKSEKKEKRNENETRVLFLTQQKIQIAHIVPAKGNKKNKIKENYQ